MWFTECFLGVVYSVHFQMWYTVFFFNAVYSVLSGVVSKPVQCVFSGVYNVCFQMYTVCVVMCTVCF